MLYLTWLMQEEEKVKRNYNFEQCITHYLPSPSSPLLLSSPHLTSSVLFRAPLIHYPLLSPPLPSFSLFSSLSLPFFSSLSLLQSKDYLLCLVLKLTPRSLQFVLQSGRLAARLLALPEGSSESIYTVFCLLYCASYIILTDWLTTSNSNCPFTFPIITFI